MHPRLIPVVVVGITTALHNADIDGWLESDKSLSICVESRKVVEHCSKVRGAGIGGVGVVVDVGS